jgi:hypothetical protein
MGVPLLHDWGIDFGATTTVIAPTTAITLTNL